MATSWASLITNLGTLDPAADDGPSIAAFKAAFKTRCEMKFCFDRDQIMMPRTAALAIAVDPRYKALDIFHSYPTLRDFQQQCLLEEVTTMLQQAAPIPELARAVEVQQPPNLAAAPAVDPAHMSVRLLQRQGTGAMQAMVANVPLLPLPQERRVSPEEVIAAYRAAENMASDATQDQVLEWFRERKSEGRFAIMLQVAAYSSRPRVHRQKGLPQQRVKRTQKGALDYKQPLQRP
jgi:hypothetical protein